MSTSAGSTGNTVTQEAGLSSCNTQAVQHNTLYILSKVYI